MNFPDLKQLKKLADTCRKAGIKHFKSEGFEFTLTDYVPEKSTNRSLKELRGLLKDPVAPQEEGPTSEELLFWSSAVPADPQQ